MSSKMAVHDDGGDLIMLMENTQLQKLALLLRNNEEAQMMNAFKSQYERDKYVKSVNDAYDNVISLLNDSNNLKNKYAEGNKDKTSIAQDILDYIKYGLNMSMQNVRNCCLRVKCIEKITTHFNTLVKDLEDLDPENLPNVRRMAKDVDMFKKCMWEYCNKCRSGTARALSKAYSMLLKQEGIKFPNLVERHKNELGFEGDFESLGEAQKLEVYNNIIRESGRAEIPTIEIASTTFGVAVLVVTAGLMVWDIFTAAHTIEAVLSNSLSALSEVGAFAVQVAVEAAVTEAVAEVDLGVFIVSLAGFVAGTVAGLIFVAVSGLLIDLIFGSGGNTAPPVTDLKFHTAKMPDGMALANEIAHD